MPRNKNTRNNIIGKFLSFDSVDWQRTVAYSMGHVGQVYLNVAGRELQGIVDLADYDSKLQEVIAVLEDLHDENGRCGETFALTAQIMMGDDFHFSHFSL